MPSIDDLQKKMSVCVLFSNLGLPKVFARVPLNHESKQYVTIATLKGLYQYNRLPYGVACAIQLFISVPWMRC